MENNMIFLGETGEWVFYKYYYDEKNNCFVEEKYHDEYLDTGTVFDGSKVVSAQYVYDEFVQNLNTNGINLLLKYCDDKQIQYTSDKGITEEEFCQKLVGFGLPLNNSFTKTEDTVIWHNKEKSFKGKLSKAEHFYIYEDSYRKGKGFKTQNEAFAYAVECLELYYKHQYTKDANEAKGKNQEKENDKKAIKPDRVKSLNEKTELKKRKKLLIKLALISLLIYILISAISLVLSEEVTGLFAVLSDTKLFFLQLYFLML